MANAARWPSPMASIEGRRPAHRVAAGEHLGVRGGEVEAVGGDASPEVGDRELVRQPGQVDGQADGGDDRVAGDDELRAGDGARAAAPALVGLAELHARAAQAGDATGRVHLDAQRRRQVLEAQALLLALEDLPRVGRHLVARAPVHQRHVALAAFHRLQAQRAARGVHGHRAAADHDDVVADGGAGRRGSRRAGTPCRGARRARRRSRPRAAATRGCRGRGTPPRSRRRAARRARSRARGPG